MGKKIVLLVTLLLILTLNLTTFAYGDWLWPVPDSFYVNSLDYYNNGNLHSQGQSIDIGILGYDTPRPNIISCTDGTVVSIVDTYPDYGIFDGSWGNYVMVQYNGYNIVYAHLKSVSAEAYASLENGTPISAGTVLGVMGTSGNSTGVHLHLQVYSASSPLGSYDTSFVVFDEFLDNPAYYPYFKFWTGLEKYSKRYGLRIKTNYKNFDGIYYGYSSDDPSYASYSMSVWAQTEIENAVGKNLIPLDMCINYQDYISRVDFCRLAVRFLETTTGKSIVKILSDRGIYADTTVFSDTHNVDVSCISALGIVSGRGDGTFDPYSPVTRQEAAAMITRMAGIIGVYVPNGTPLQYDDSQYVADWAKDSVDFVSGMTDTTIWKPVMGGLDGNNFEPLGVFTRQQAYIAMNRMYNAIYN